MSECGNCGCSDEELVCETCSKQIKAKQVVCVDETGGADSPVHYHKKCWTPPKVEDYLHEVI